MLDIEGLRFRAALFHAIRFFFRQEGFLEVDTPVRQPVIIPESNIEPIPSGSWFLQTSPEQCMKRLLAAGCDKIFQICPCFRAKERGSRHLEEFTMLEWYRSGGDYRDLMDDCVSLLRSIVESLSKQGAFKRKMERSRIGTANLEGPWDRISVARAFSQWGTIPLQEALETDRFDEIISVEIEPRLGIDTPAFLTDYPAACASLARLKENDPTVAERFELYINGIELANGFSELTDSAEQRRRFAEELALIREQRAVVMRMPDRFLADLDRIPRAAGIAFGLDRLLMLLLSADRIDDVVNFAPGDWG